ncbi:hypothetical protein H2198_001232 [Neophaeococcomyces mojaviensis]|uniref:Uncharacterized protein n=1 Tax=Neophaeococcomyces mojaviensis TaxID=3383035 RepID=A0ACC3AHQ1_9EURO|nr:hypothetical protein H2198_001232 [Knufia sp. JES_112]
MPKSSTSTRISKGDQKRRGTTRKPKSKKPALSQKLLTDGVEGQISSPPVYFWKPHEDWGFLGQWYIAPMTDRETGVQFNCCEQYMMYHKAVTFKDQELELRIMDETDPRMLKALGRKISGFTEDKWNEVKFDIVVRANMMKFTQAQALQEDEFVKSIAEHAEGQEPPSLRSLLLATGDREIVEASSRDRIWGIGFAAKQAEKQPRSKCGKNLLGKALMEVRKRLREEEQSKI